MKQFVFLFAACCGPVGFLSAESADGSRSVDELRSIVLEAEANFQEKEAIASPADKDVVTAESEVSIISTIDSTEDAVEKEVQETAVDEADSPRETEVHVVPSYQRYFIRLSFNADEDTALSTIVNDRQSKLQINDKIVVIGPDGKHQEFAISGNEAGKVFKIVTGVEATGDEDQHANQIDSIVRLMKRHDASDGKPMSESRLAIGVQCECVPDALRSHLDLGEKGIMVGHVKEESPASEAALMKFDIIVQIGDTDIKETDDLVSSVAASEGKELTLSIIRHGKPMKILVTPRIMEFPLLLAPAQTNLFLGDLNAQSAEELAGNPAWESLPESAKKQIERQIAVQNSLRKFHPGIVIEQRMPSNEKDMQQLIEHARKLAEDSGRVAQIRTQKAFEAVESGVSGEVADNIVALRDQMRSMEQKLEQLQKRLDVEADDKK